MLFRSETFERARVVATLEEHSVLGGFGSAVCEWLADQVKPRARLMRIGTADTFLHEAGDQAYARARNKLTAPQIAQRIREAID